MGIYCRSIINSFEHFNRYELQYEIELCIQVRVILRTANDEQQDQGTLLTIIVRKWI